ncbi:MAG: lipopolysaccharide kinase InaA family protein [Methylotenera sp.]
MQQIYLKNASPIHVETVVRTVPHQREVVRGTWQDAHGKAQKIYAKFFFGARAAQHYARDLSGITDLVAAKIPTPPLLFQGQDASGLAYILIFSEIQNALNAEESWQNLDEKARFNLAKRLVAEIAKHHNAGLLQTDLYLKNFLVDNDKIYTLDGDGIRKFTRLSQQRALKNLSVLLSKFDVLEVEVWLADLLKAYAEDRGWGTLRDAGSIKKMTNTHRQKVASHYADKKVFRQCADVKSYALESSWILVCRAYENIDFSGNLDALLTEQNLLKRGNTCTVALAEIDGKKAVIKRYNIKNFWHGLSRAVRQTRAAASWANAHRLKILGIATVQPIALIENPNFGFLNGKAYFLAEYIDAPDAAEFFSKTHNKKARADAVKNIVILFYKLFLLKISHGDMKATNIKMLDNKPVLIDLDSMQQHRFDAFALTAHVRDLRRFMQNWQDDNALYNAFVETYRVIYEDFEPLEKAGIFQNKEIA